MVVEFLFIMKSSGPDLDTVMGFLMKRVSKSDVDNWGKLRSVLRFVHCNFKEKRFL